MSTGELNEKLPVMKLPEKRSGVLMTASATAALALQSSVEAVLPMAQSSSVMVFFARPVLGMGVSVLLLPLLRDHRPAGGITALGLVMMAALALVPETLLAYHWAALAGAFVKVPLLCSLLAGDPSWAGWRITGAFYGLLLGPMVTSLLPEGALRILLSLSGFSMAVLHFAVANGWSKGKEMEVPVVSIATGPSASLSLAGVVLAWLLLSVQLSLVPLLHAQHGHPLAEHHVALGVSLLLSSLLLQRASPRALVLALMTTSCACSLAMRGVAQSLHGYDVWQLQGFRLLMQMSLGILLAATSTAIGRFSRCPAAASVLGCSLAAAAFFGEGVGLVLQLLLLPALGALNTMKVLAFLPLCFGFLSLRQLPAIYEDVDLPSS